MDAESFKKEVSAISSQVVLHSLLDYWRMLPMLKIWLQEAYLKLWDEDGKDWPIISKSGSIQRYSGEKYVL